MTPVRPSRPQRVHQPTLRQAIRLAQQLAKLTDRPVTFAMPCGNGTQGYDVDEEGTIHREHEYHAREAHGEYLGIAAGARFMRAKTLAKNTVALARDIRQDFPESFRLPNPKEPS